MLLVKYQPSPFTPSGGSKGDFPHQARALLLGLRPIEALEFLRLLDRQADQDPPANSINKIPSWGRAAWSNHTEACAWYPMETRATA